MAAGSVALAVAILEWNTATALAARCRNAPARTTSCLMKAIRGCAGIERLLTSTIEIPLGNWGYLIATTLE